MQSDSFDVIRIPTHGPGDVSGLMALIDSGALESSSILAVLGKTEGNGGVNDFTREYAVAALCNALSSHLRLAPREVAARIAFVMSGGYRRIQQCSREAHVARASVGTPARRD
jgi:cyanuric acid amidohydrolase